MDLLTHLLTGIVINEAHKKPVVGNNMNLAFLLAGCLLPDIGEIFIQNALSEKFGTKYAVYDDRTSDLEVASQIQVTFIYDLFHSFVFALFIYLLYRLFKQKYNIFSKSLYFLSIGLCSHILLDCATHGKVWALKLFFPLSNVRIKIFEDTVGNWWDWKPTVQIPIIDIPFPIICFGIWFILISLYIYFNQKSKYA
jgi:LexA-binding, inner membrane-associated putative hydrolase